MTLQLSKDNICLQKILYEDYLQNAEHPDDVSKLNKSDSSAMEDSVEYAEISKKPLTSEEKIKLRKKEAKIESS